MARPRWLRSAMIVACLAGAWGGIAPASADEGANVPVVGADDADAIPGQYIVVIRPGADAVANRLAAVAQARGEGALVRHEYGAALQGFAARLPPRALDALRRNPHVEYIEADQVVRSSATQSPAPWGLDRVDQRNLPLSGSYTYNGTGAGVTVYVVDSGITYSHPDFGGRAVSGFDALDGGSADDVTGHGTHVAGIVGGMTYGIAKSVRIVGVRVLDYNGSGPASALVAGIDWVTANHVAGTPAVANLSLGGTTSPAKEMAVRNSIADGITYVTSAGNDAQDACTSWPPNVPEVVTVGSISETGARSSFSNIGTCLDLFGPGSNIVSAAGGGGSVTKSGTSMAAPHVSGAAALYLQQHPTATPQAVQAALVNSATTGVVGDAGTGSPNRLLYTLGSSSPPPPPPPPPGCAGLSEQYTGTLTGSGDFDIQPNGASFPTADGTLRGCLDGPTGADFTLALFRQDAGRWVRVAVSATAGADESITYAAISGNYRWRIVSVTGSGSYQFAMRR